MDGLAGENQNRLESFVFYGGGDDDYQFKNTKVGAKVSPPPAAAVIQQSLKFYIIFTFQGVLTEEKLRSCITDLDSDFYFCGPSGFMLFIDEALKKFGVPEKQRKYEYFGPTLD